MVRKSANFSTLTDILRQIPTHLKFKRIEKPKTAKPIQIKGLAVISTIIHIINKVLEDTQMCLITFEHHFGMVRKKPLQDWLHVVIGANLVRILNINNTQNHPTRKLDGFSVLNSLKLSQTVLLVELLKCC